MTDPSARTDGTTLDPAGWPPGVSTAADRERFARYAASLAFYRGEQWLGRPRRGEPRLTFNYARTLLRKVAAYVFPAPAAFAVPLPPQAPAGETGETGEVGEETANRVERALADLIAELDLARLDVDLCVDAAVLGDAAVKVTWDAAAGRPAVAPVDPGTLVVATAPDDPRRIRRVSQVYGLAGEEVAALFGRVGEAPPGSPPRVRAQAPPHPAEARRYAVAEHWTAERWRVEMAGQTIRDEPNPYGWIPYVLLANNPRPQAVWGESDLVDLVDVCRELNARMSALSRVLELSGSPIAVLENVDGSEGISVGPGAKWELPEGAKAYLLDLLAGGGVGLHVQYVDVLYRSLHDLAETPRTAFGDAGRDLSGAALEVEIQPLVQKVGRKRRAWDAFYRERNARLLDLGERLGGQDFGGLRRTATLWPNVLPSDRDGAVRQAAALVAAGIHSRRTAVATLGGDDPAGELDRVVEEGRRLAGLGAAVAE